MSRPLSWFAALPVLLATLANTTIGHTADGPPRSEVTPPRLAAPLILPPAPPTRRDVAVTVQIQLTVTAEGATTDLVPAPGTDPKAPPRAPTPLEALAIEALKRAKLVPATRDGLAVAVRIVVPVTFGASRVVTELRYDRREVEPVPTVERGVDGRVVERGTRKAVAGAQVLLLPPGGDTPIAEALTDDDGRFAFRDLAKGRYRIVVPFFAGDEGAEASVVAPGSATLRVTPDALREYRTRVAGGSPVTDASRIRIPVERAREIPGSAGDPVKVIESLPGVARPAAAGPGAGEIAIRGSAPEDTKTYIDGLPLFQLYHFGNVYSVLQDEWIQDIDFRAGGFSTGFGDATGGLIDVTLADLKDDGAHGHLDINVYHVAGLFTVPLSDDWTVGGAVRRSWVDAIIGGIAGDDVRFSTAPRYYDYQVRGDYRPSDDVKLRLLAFGSDDQIIVLGSSPDADDPNGSSFEFSRFFHQVQGRLELPLADDLGFSLGVATSYQQLFVSPGDNAFTLTFCPLTVRADLDWRTSESVRIRGGLWTDVNRFRVELDVPRPTKEGEVQLPSEVLERFDITEKGFSGRVDAWGETIVELSPELLLSGGFRLGSWWGNFVDFAPDLRLAASWAPGADATRLTLTGGLNHQAPAPDETAESIGNPDLSPERAAYVNLGVEQRIGDILSLEVQGFYKSLDQLVVATDAADDPAVPYDNAGTGTIYGGELLVRLQHPIVDAWVAYTLSRSRRVDRPGEPERFFSFDQTHVLAVVAGVQLGAGWRFGTRLRYATGNPFTPLEPAYFDAGADVWIPRAAGAPLSARAAAFFQLDLRVDKTFLFDDWKLDLYLEVSNATNRENIEAIFYSDDYRSRDDITSLPLTPSLGIRGSF